MITAVAIRHPAWQEPIQLVGGLPGCAGSGSMAWTKPAKTSAGEVGVRPDPTDCTGPGRSVATGCAATPILTGSMGTSA